MKNKIFNPFLPGWEYIPDGEPHVFGNRVYLFGSHDRFGGDAYCQNDYVCWSAPTDDLSDWVFHGKIYDITDDPFNADSEYCGYAPDVCRGPDGKYYLYYALSHHGSLSVAVSDTPEGKYRFLGHIKTPSGRIYGLEKGDCYCFDPGVFVDDDNSVHLYIGFSPTKYMDELAEKYKDWMNDGAYHFELCEDMLTIKTEPVMVVPGDISAKGSTFENHAFFEAPSMRKFEDKYYFIYSSEKYNELCCGVSETPIGPFAYVGVLVSNCDMGYNGNALQLNHDGNNHGSIEKIGDKYYIFYHRHTNMTPYSRQACAEILKMEENGAFCQSEITSTGMGENAFEACGEYSARIACNLVGADYDFCSDKTPYFTQSGGDRESLDDQYIKNMHSGSFAGFKYFEFSGNETLYVKVRASGNGFYEVRNKLDSEPSGKIFINPCENETWFKAEGNIPEGSHPLYFTYRGEGCVDFISFKFEN